MRKFAWSAAIGCVAACAAMAANVEPRLLTEPVPAFTAETPCRSAAALDSACAARADDGETMLADWSELTDSAPPAAGWAPLHTPPGAGQGFQDTAAEAGTLQATLPDSDTSHRLIPALLAMGGLLVLLRKRPT